MTATNKETELLALGREIAERRKAIIQEWLKTHERPQRGIIAREEQKKLDEEEPIKTFVQLMIDKSARKQIAGTDLYNDIINSSSKSRKSVNKKFGLE